MHAPHSPQAAGPVVGTPHTSRVIWPNVLFISPRSDEKNRSEWQHRSPKSNNNPTDELASSFGECPSLAAVRIGDSVAHIGDWAGSRLRLLPLPHRHAPARGRAARRPRVRRLPVAARAVRRLGASGTLLGFARARGGTPSCGARGQWRRLPRGAKARGARRRGGAPPARGAKARGNWGPPGAEGPGRRDGARGPPHRPVFSPLVCYPPVPGLVLPPLSPHVSVHALWPDVGNVVCATRTTCAGHCCGKSAGKSAGKWQVASGQCTPDVTGSTREGTCLVSLAAADRPPRESPMAW